MPSASGFRAAEPPHGIWKAPPAYRLQEVFLCFHIRSPASALQAERDGLYWNVSAVCSKDWDFPIRLIAETDGARTVLGVPQPEPDGLRLRARLSNRSCPFSGQTRILTDQTPEPEPEPEPAPAEPELLPFEPEKPFERISEFSVMNVAEQGGKPYWKVPG